MYASYRPWIDSTAKIGDMGKKYYRKYAREKRVTKNILQEIISRKMFWGRHGKILMLQ